MNVNPSSFRSLAKTAVSAASGVLPQCIHTVHYHEQLHACSYTAFQTMHRRVYMWYEDHERDTTLQHNCSPAVTGAILNIVGDITVTAVTITRATDGF